MNEKSYSIEVGGKEIVAEFTDLADQATGSVIIRSGETAVLVTAVMSDEETGMPYFPLKVDYEERFYASGNIFGSRYTRREGRPTDEAILSARIVDRTIRPLFDGRIRHDIQVVVTVLSLGEEDPDVLAVLGASLALGTSSIPWNGPVGAVRIIRHKEEKGFVVNPTYTALEQNGIKLDVLACGKERKINMIEIGAHETPENEVMEALEKAVEEISPLESWQQSIINEIGKEKQILTLPEVSEEAKTLFESSFREKARAALFETTGKGAIRELNTEWREAVETLPEGERAAAFGYLDNVLDEIVHEEALEKGRRADGRGFEEIRPLFIKAGRVSPRLHGSGTFYRGGTHVLSVVTLGGPEDTQLLEGMEEQGEKRYFHHYNFPPFSVGETGRIGSPGRREIGHGALAEKALRPVLPTQSEFPYTIRVVSEAFASNGSTSMASTCGSTIALMDAGVPIKKPVAGIAVGLMSSKSNYVLLTDIQGPEDHHGDMDFKVTGTTEGVTAVQMDVKVAGVTLEILREALERGKKARHEIIDQITSVISAPRQDLSPYAPRIISIQINPDDIGLVIGSGGKTIQNIKKTTEVDEISIEDDGTVFIIGKTEQAQAAQKMIETITKRFSVGERADGVVEKVLEFGAVVKLNPQTDGLVHISEIAPFRIEKVSDYLAVGETIPVIIKEIDERGRLKLSLKDADPEYAQKHTKSSPNNQ